MTAVKQEFIHKVDKAKIPTCNILGVDIAAVDMVWLLDYLNDNIHALSGDYICVSNVHTTVTAYEDVEYRKVQNGGIMAIPDGGPLSSVGQKRGFKNMKRTTGPSLWGKFSKFLFPKGIDIFFTAQLMKLLKNSTLFWRRLILESRLLECTALRLEL